MLFSKSIRRSIFGLLAVASISYGLKLSAHQLGRQLDLQQEQQGSNLTPPPKPATIKSAPAVSEPASTQGSPFVVGEKLSFNVSWSNFPTAARLELEVTDRGRFHNQDSYLIKTRVETLGQVRSLFGGIDNQYTSYINANTGVPNRIENSIRQGQRQVEETVILDQVKQQAIFPDESTVQIAPGTYDLTSMVYALRMRALNEDSRQKMAALYDKELIEIEAVVKKRERITIQSGTYNTVCVKFYPQNKFTKSRGYVWFSDDAQKLPVLIKATLPFGELRAEMTNVTITSRSAPAIAKVNLPPDESGYPPPIGVGTKGTNGENDNHGIDERTLPFAVGEKLNYDISWGAFSSVGRASFEVRQEGMLGNRRIFELYGEATSAGAARTLINVNDQLSSFALADSLMPIRTDVRLREGRRLRQVSSVYDWASNTATVSTGGRFSIRPGTFDLVSLFYAIRSSELKIGSTQDYLFLTANNRLRMLRVNVVKEETIGGPMGDRNAIQIDILASVPNRSVLAQVWLSNDSRRLPLYIATRTTFGELRLQMTTATGTK